MNEVTRILSNLAEGNPHAADELLPLVYEELRKLAAARMAAEAADHTLSATALVHEAYLRLVGPGEATRWESRGHFFAAAAEAMRRLLVESARRRKRHKHGGDHQRISLEAAESLMPSPSEDLVALDEALTRLAAQEPIKAEVVKLRFFAGLTMPEIARVLNISLATVERHWTYSRAWLYAELTDADPK
jgi:RNA polymerase sigma factor (TIGR02999 family)